MGTCKVTSAFKLGNVTMMILLSIKTNLRVERKTESHY